MSEDVEFAFRGMRKYMFENVYPNPRAKGRRQKAENTLEGAASMLYGTSGVVVHRVY